MTGDTKSRIAPSVSLNLGYTAPAATFLSLHFTPEEAPDTQATLLLELLDDHGIPFMRSLNEGDAFVEAVEQFSLAREYEVPVALAFVGKTDEAQARLAREAEANRDADPDWIRWYTAFSERLLKYVADPRSLALPA